MNYLEIRHNKNYKEVKEIMTASRGAVQEILNEALKNGILTERERNILYRRQVDWNSLEIVGKEFGVTRERIRQIEAKAEEKLRVS